MTTRSLILLGFCGGFIGSLTGPSIISCSLLRPSGHGIVGSDKSTETAVTETDQSNESVAPVVTQGGGSTSTVSSFHIDPTVVVPPAALGVVGLLVAVYLTHRLGISKRALLHVVRAIEVSGDTLTKKVVAASTKVNGLKATAVSDAVDAAIEDMKGDYNLLMLWRARRLSEGTLLEEAAKLQP